MMQFSRHLPVGMAPSYHHPKPKGHCSFGFSNDGEIAVIVVRLKKNYHTGFFYNEEPAISCVVLMTAVSVIVVTNDSGNMRATLSVAIATINGNNGLIRRFFKF